MKKAISAVLALLCLIPLLKAVSINAEGLSVSAKSAILIEVESGSVLYQRDAFTKRPMASTTKIMTALVAIEAGDLDKLVKIDDRAIGVEGSSVYLAKGEVLSMRDLLYSLMLASANDAAAAIAYELAGSIDGFASLMNEKASKLGLLSTHFTNPHGLHDESHYTTAYDLARLTGYALKNPEFLDICSTKSIALPMDSGTRYLTNHNKLLRLYKGCVGVKTGFTKSSGRCLVSAAERDGMTLIAVTLNASDDWNDHERMLDFGFERYCRITAYKKGEFTAELDVAGGNLNGAVVTNSRDISLFLKKFHGEISFKAEAIRPIFAPIERGKEIGRLIYYEDGREIASSPLITVTKVEKAQKKRGVSMLVKRLFNTLKRNVWKK